MNRAWGTINALVREERLVYEAIYQPSYRHSARRIDHSFDCVGWPTEADAVAVLKSQARADGCEITIRVRGACFIYPHAR